MAINVEITPEQMQEYLNSVEVVEIFDFMFHQPKVTITDGLKPLGNYERVDGYYKEEIFSKK